VKAQGETKDDADDQTDERDGAILAIEIGLSPFLHRPGDLAHPVGAGRRCHYGASG
jgi:hypothetical protein